jgi:ppGpp synthetase/RelA/SpoT-type nucleotidyltranferase
MVTDWQQPNYSRSKVDWAGSVLSALRGTDEEILEAYEIIDNWRASHAFPLNTIQTGLRAIARDVSSQAIVAQRLKRFESILMKLRREKAMNLSRMQDIGGCRAVVKSVRQVHQIRNRYRRSRMRHELIGEKDYGSSWKRVGRS